MVPVPLHDELEVERRGGGLGVELRCGHPGLPVDGGNLVHRAATRFLEAAGIGEGVAIRLEKRLPLAAGLGGGSANAAVTLRLMSELFPGALEESRLGEIAAGLGSDVPFFLQEEPALGTGRGERVRGLGAFSALSGSGMLLVHPGFGVSTPWAYGALAGFPEALNGRSGRAEEMIGAFRGTDLGEACRHLYNSLEAPVLEKHPLLRIFQDFFREQGAVGALMSGSGSTTFALFRDLERARAVGEAFRARFGDGMWVAAVGM